MSVATPHGRAQGLQACAGQRMHLRLPRRLHAVSRGSSILSTHVSDMLPRRQSHGKPACRSDIIWFRALRTSASYPLEASTVSDGAHREALRAVLFPDVSLCRDCASRQAGVDSCCAVDRIVAT